MASGVQQWRRFNFFDKEIVKRKGGKPLEDVKNIQVIASTSTNGAGDGQLIFGCSDGSLCVINRDYEANHIRSFDISLQLLAHSAGDTLIAIGMDENETKQTIKLWKTDKTLVEKENTEPAKIISILPNDHPNSKICAVAITDRHIVLGCENGAIYFFASTDLIKEKRYKFTTPFYQAEKPITNLALVEGTKPHGGLIVYATTETNVLSFRLIPTAPTAGISTAVAVAASVSSTLTSTLRDRRPFHLTHHQQPPAQFNITILETHIGCSPRCAVLAQSDLDGELQFVIANSTGVFSYVGEDKRVGLAIEGEKLTIHWWFNYLIVVTKENRKAITTTSTTTNPTNTQQQSAILLQLAADSIHKTTTELQTLAVYDTNPQLQAYSVGISRIQCVLDEWGYIHILTGDGELHRLIEKDLHSRLNILFKKNQYQLALQLAKKNQTSKQGMAEIFKQFGDHLYAKNEFESATDQYCKTIGFLEPSYVIKKFLDSQHIDHLTRYLEELHRAKLANVDHTTLLLNCYTKHPDRINRLAQFIGLNENSGSTPDVELTFDVDIAIDVCRQANYLDEALALSAKYRRHDKYIKIQCENKRDYDRALTYIQTLKFDDALQAFRNYGKTLIKQQPKLTTKLLKQLNPTPQQIEQEQLPESLINLFMNNPDELLDYLEYAVKQYPKEHLVSTVYDTILELLLQKYSTTEDKKELDRLSHQIITLLQDSKIGIDVTRAMVACQKYNFKAGVICLYDKAKLYQQILQYQMKNKESDKIVSTCLKYGDEDPQLWIQALSYFSKLKRADGCRKEIQQILKYIDEKDLLSPLLVIQTLSNNESTSLDLLKDYLIRKLHNEQTQIEKDQSEIRRFRQESELFVEKIKQLETDPILCQDPKCSACKMDLDIPCIHFFCEHSFHEHCAYAVESATSSEITYECPLCSGDNRKWLDLINMQRVSKDIHETFHRKIDDQQDKFGVIAEFLGRRLFDKVR
ncbi:unnamed protein product [Adineta steineri]|uniref:Vacuolar protein sorting-associated protein 11 homolog n=1 Tax=Adineta steineri TaxID=433720 RepID=A0A814URJ8_9BILA|nr:unnamed protein product [Adineta steineri]CAF1240298.1 unnamed protein product [Adineta steineri]